MISTRGHFGDPRTVEIKVADPNFKCCFCGRHQTNPAEWGDLLELDGVVTHHFCLLFSAMGEQRGTDDEGIFAFLPVDIKKEVNRGKRLTCKFCKKKTATIGCVANRCPYSFHYTCGYENGCRFQFHGQFESFCPKHKMVQKIPKGTCSECPICFTDVDVRVDEGIWPPCCGKQLFHRSCIMQAAKAAGYFFKCPLCNSKEAVFLDAMKTNGVFVPEQDAAWEREENAFQELTRHYSRCDAEVCQCPHGRDFKNRKDLVDWDLVRCNTCGSSATHMKCSSLQLRSWKCTNCKAILKEPALPALEAEAEDDANDPTLLIPPVVENTNTDSDVDMTSECESETEYSSRDKVKLRASSDLQNTEASSDLENTETSVEITNESYNNEPSDASGLNYSGMSSLAVQTISNDPQSYGTKLANTRIEILVNEHEDMNRNRIKGPRDSGVGGIISKTGDFQDRCNAGAVDLRKKRIAAARSKPKLCREPPPTTSREERRREAEAAMAVKIQELVSPKSHEAEEEKRRRLATIALLTEMGAPTLEQVRKLPPIPKICQTWRSQPVMADNQNSPSLPSIHYSQIPQSVTTVQNNFRKCEDNLRIHNSGISQTNATLQNNFQEHENHLPAHNSEMPHRNVTLQHNFRKSKREDKLPIRNSEIPQRNVTTSYQKCDDKLPQQPPHLSSSESSAASDTVMNLELLEESNSTPQNGAYSKSLPRPTQNNSLLRNPFASLLVQQRLYNIAYGVPEETPKITPTFPSTVTSGGYGSSPRMSNCPNTKNPVIETIELLDSSDDEEDIIIEKIVTRVLNQSCVSEAGYSNGFSNSKGISGSAPYTFTRDVNASGKGEVNGSAPYFFNGDANGSEPNNYNRDSIGSTHYNFNRDFNGCAPYNRDVNRSAPYQFNRDVNRSGPYHFNGDVDATEPFIFNRDLNGLEPESYNLNGNVNGSAHYNLFEQRSSCTTTAMDHQFDFGRFPEVERGDHVSNQYIPYYHSTERENGAWVSGSSMQHDHATPNNRNSEMNTQFKVYPNPHAAAFKYNMKPQEKQYEQDMKRRRFE